MDSPVKNSSKGRLQSFTLQKKLLETSSTTLSSSAKGKPTTSQNPVLIGKKTHGTITKMATYVPSEQVDTPPKPKPSVKKPVVKKVTQQSEILQASIEMKTRREQLQALVELGIPLGMIPISSSIQGTASMPTKGMPPIRGLLDREEVDGLLKGELTAKSKNIVQKILLFKNCITDTPEALNERKKFRSNWKKPHYNPNQRPPEKSYRPTDDRRQNYHDKDRRRDRRSPERREYSKHGRSYHSREDRRVHDNRGKDERKVEYIQNKERKMQDESTTKDNQNTELKSEVHSIETPVIDPTSPLKKEKEMKDDHRSILSKDQPVQLTEKKELIEDIPSEKKVLLVNSPTKENLPEEVIVEKQCSEEEPVDHQVENEYFKSFKKNSFQPVEDTKRLKNKRNHREYSNERVSHCSINDFDIEKKLDDDEYDILDKIEDCYSPGMSSSYDSPNICTVSKDIAIEEKDKNIFKDSMSWINITHYSLMKHVNPRCIRETNSRFKICYSENTKHCSCDTDKTNTFKGNAEKFNVFHPNEIVDSIAESSSRKWYPKTKDFLSNYQTPETVKESPNNSIQSSTRDVDSDLEIGSKYPIVEEQHQATQVAKETKPIVQLDDFDIESNVDESLDKEYVKFMESVCPDGSINSDDGEQQNLFSIPQRTISREESLNKELIAKINEIDLMEETKKLSQDNENQSPISNQQTEIENDALKSKKKRKSKKKSNKKADTETDDSSDSSSDDSSSSSSSSTSSQSSSSSSSSSSLSSLLSDIASSSSESESSSSSSDSSSTRMKKWKAKRKKQLKRKLARKIARKLKKQQKKLLSLKKFKIKKKKADRQKSSNEDSNSGENKNDVTQEDSNDATLENTPNEKSKISKKQKKKKQRKRSKKKMMKTSSSDSSSSDTDESVKSDLFGENIAEFTSSNITPVKKEVFSDEEVFPKPNKTVTRKYFNTQIINITELQSDFMVNNFPASRNEIKRESVDTVYSQNKDTSISENSVDKKIIDQPIKKNKSDIENSTQYSRIKEEEDWNDKSGEETSETHQPKSNENNSMFHTDVRPIPTISAVYKYKSEEMTEDASWDWPLSEDMVSSMKYSKKWEMSQDLYHNTTPTLVEVPISNTDESNESKSNISNSAVNKVTPENHIRGVNSQEYYNIQTISSNATGRLTDNYTTNENITIEKCLHCLDDTHRHENNIIGKRNIRTISLEDRINMVLQCSTIKNENGAEEEDNEEEENDTDEEETICLPPITILPSPDKGILINIDAIGIKDTLTLKRKSVSFADGFTPGDDSDIEEEVVPPKKKKKSNENKEDSQKKPCNGHTYPCPPSWPDYSDQWDTLPPPLPPPGSPPSNFRFYCVQDTITILPNLVGKMEPVA